jgi:phosphoribosylformylglycinamidine synthase
VILTTSEPDAVLGMLKDVPATVIGTVGGGGLKISGSGFEVSLSHDEMAWARGSLTRVMME